MDSPIAGAVVPQPASPSPSHPVLAAPSSQVSRRGYAIAGTIAVLALVIGGAVIVRGVQRFSDRVDAFQRVAVPGTSEISLTRVGDFTIYYELAGVAGRNGTDLLPPITINMRTADGEVLPLREYKGEFTYSIGGHEGRAVATFHIDSPGTYQLSSSSEAQPGIGQLAVGKGLGSLFVQVFVPILVVGAVLLAALALAIVTAVRRRRTQ